MFWLLLKFRSNFPVMHSRLFFLFFYLWPQFERATPTTSRHRPNPSSERINKNCKDLLPVGDDHKQYWLQKWNNNFLNHLIQVCNSNNFWFRFVCTSRHILGVLLLQECASSAWSQGLLEHDQFGASQKSLMKMEPEGLGLKAAAQPLEAYILYGWIFSMNAGESLNR